MLISFTGVQSSGKSTLLDNCQSEFGDKFVYVPEITRDIKKTFGVAINEAGDDFTQSLIVSKHIENYLSYLNCKKDTILDRCIVDGLAYTTWLNNRGRVSDTVYEFCGHTFMNLAHRMDVIFYTNPHDVQLVDDGERSNSVKFRNEMISIFHDIMVKYYQVHDNLVMLKGSVEERMETIRKTLTNKGINL